MAVPLTEREKRRFPFPHKIRQLSALILNAHPWALQAA